MGSSIDAGGRVGGKDTLDSSRPLRFVINGWESLLLLKLKRLEDQIQFIPDQCVID